VVGWERGLDSGKDRQARVSTERPGGTELGSIE
jgi:hypothetical protein